MIVYTPLLGCLQEPVAIALSRLPYVPYDEDRGLHVVGYALHVLGELLGAPEGGMASATHPFVGGVRTSAFGTVDGTSPHGEDRSERDLVPAVPWKRSRHVHGAHDVLDHDAVVEHYVVEILLDVCQTVVVDLAPGILPYEIRDG